MSSHMYYKGTYVIGEPKYRERRTVKTSNAINIFIINVWRLIRCLLMHFLPIKKLTAGKFGRYIKAFIN